MFRLLRSIGNDVLRSPLVWVCLSVMITLLYFDRVQTTALPRVVDPLPPFETTSSPQSLSRSLPTSLRIPRINLTTTFVDPLGLTRAGEVEVPAVYDQVGWYQYSPTPGELGPAIILGHVDSFAGPAVFYNLKQLAVGDDIFVEREDGTVAHFAVTSIGRYEQSDFPTVAVYGNIDHAGLRLITCTGVFVRGVERYTHNLVVYARLIEASST